jgi:hypothetical protein
MILNFSALIIATAALAVPITTAAPRGYDIRYPAVISTPIGVRVHGRVCRHSSNLPPLKVRADHIGPDGQVLSSVSHSLSGLSRRASSCTVFDLPADWILARGDMVKLCAFRSLQTCVTQ